VSKPLDELFFEWLYSQVADPETNDPERMYSRLLHQLYTKEFIAVVDRDENRIEDAKELRHEFIAERHIRRRETSDWLDLGCSVLELLVGLSRRMAFDAEGEPHYWFWIMMRNLGLAHLSDAYPRYSEGRVAAALDRLIYRQYEYDGKGGLFPLHDPNKDQRTVELWYQLSAYVLELEHS
jgi:hypothetical protein